MNMGLKRYWIKIQLLKEQSYIYLIYKGDFLEASNCTKISILNTSYKLCNKSDNKMNSNVFRSTVLIRYISRLYLFILGYRFFLSFFFCLVHLFNVGIVGWLITTLVNYSNMFPCVLSSAFLTIYCLLYTSYMCEK